MKRSIVLSLCSIGFTVFCVQSIFASENIKVSPSNTRLLLVSELETKDLGYSPSYLYKDYNYFCLRDIGNLMGYGVAWDDLEKQIILKKDIALNETINYQTPAISRMSFLSMQTIAVLNDKTKIEYNNIECINVNGYNYFKLRDLSSIMNFTFDWDINDKAIILNQKETTSTNSKVNMDNIIKSFINPDINQKVIEDETVIYVSKSNDFNNIETYMQKNIDDTFIIEDYIITEDRSYDSIGSLLMVLDIRYSVHGVPVSNFGYRIVCIDSQAKIINFIGEEKPAIVDKQLIPPVCTDEEIKQKSYEKYPTEFKISEETIRRFFDGNDMQFKFEINRVYVDEKGGFWSKNYILTENDFL